MKTSTTKTKPNPVGKIVTQQMRELLDKIDAATSKTRPRIFIDADWNEGYAFEDGNVQPIGPAHAEIDAFLPKAMRKSEPTS